MATLVRLFGDIDLAEEAVQEAFVVARRALAGSRAAAQPGRLDHHHRPQPGHRPAAPGVDPRTTATPRPRCSHEQRRAAETGGPGARRPAAPDLHLLPPGAGAARAGRADPAAARRARDRRDRPRLPRARGRPWPSGSSGPSARSATPSIPYRVPARRRAARPAPARAGRGLPGLQRGLRGHAPATRSSATTCAPRRSGWPGCSSS